tara:strand:- start:118 stop:240 length:123 start_codon:yes stop_codon:yes gene_type:complete
MNVQRFGSFVGFVSFNFGFYFFLFGPEVLPLDEHFKKVTE